MEAPTRNPEELMQTIAVRRYVLISILALFLLLLMLLEKKMGEWSLLPITFGCIALFIRVRFGPPLVILTLIVMFLRDGYRDDPIRLVLRALGGRFAFPAATFASSLSDLFLALAVVVYCVAFYRIQSIVNHILPLDPRRKQLVRVSPGKRDYQERRTPERIPRWESFLLPFVGLLWALISLGIWTWVADQTPWPGFSRSTWQFLVLFWLLTLGLLGAIPWLAYLDSALAGAEAARVLLQDQLWKETRRDQMRIKRMITGARLRRQRGKEKL
jgi:hypothetical protein